MKSVRDDSGLLEHHSFTGEAPGYDTNVQRPGTAQLAGRSDPSPGMRQTLQKHQDSCDTGSNVIPASSVDQSAGANRLGENAEISPPNAEPNAKPQCPIPPSSNESPLPCASKKCLMSEEFGQQRVDTDVRHLVKLCMVGGNVTDHLLGLLMFATTSNLSDLSDEFDQAIHILCFDQVNSTAALQIRPRLPQTMTYPLFVRLWATAVSQRIPCVFFVDVLYAIINAIFNKEYCVQMGRWKFKSRHWWLGAANVGEGKSPGMKHFINAMVDVLEKTAASCCLIR